MPKLSENVGTRIAEIVPYNTLADKYDKLPTTFSIKKQVGLIIWGNETRCVENSGFTGLSRPRSGLFVSERRRNRENASKEEVLVQGNLPIPLQFDYYFEMMILKVESTSLVSIGIAPEEMMIWGDNSYHFQSDRTKVFFSIGVRKDDSYGEYFQNECVVGCGWKHETNSIYFTKKWRRSRCCL